MRSWSALAFFLVAVCVSAYFRMYYLTAVSVLLIALLIVGWGNDERKGGPRTAIADEGVPVKAGCGSGCGGRGVCGKGGGVGE